MKKYVITCFEGQKTPFPLRHSKGVVCNKDIPGYCPANYHMIQRGSWSVRDVLDGSTKGVRNCPEK